MPAAAGKDLTFMLVSHVAVHAKSAWDNTECEQQLFDNPVVTYPHYKVFSPLTYQHRKSGQDFASYLTGACRHARDGSVTSMFTPSAYQYNPRHSTGPSEIQRTARDLTDNAVAAPQTDDLVKLGKRDAWAQFLAFEVCILLCSQAQLIKTVWLARHNL